MDAVAVPQHLIGQGFQQRVALPALQKVRLGLGAGDKGDLPHVGDGLDLLTHRTGLLLGIAVVDVGQKFVFRLQIPQHMVQVQGHQGKRAHNQQTRYNHANRSEGHKAMGEDGVDALADVITCIKPSRHCNTRLSRR